MRGSAVSVPVPWSLHVDEEVLEDLRERIRRTRWSDSVAGAGWSHGTSIDYLRDLSSYWTDGFDWRAQERLINTRLPASPTRSRTEAIRRMLSRS
jgi:Epoxide hydrolase N terminus